MFLSRSGDHVPADKASDAAVHGRPEGAGCGSRLLRTATDFRTHFGAPPRHSPGRTHPPLAQLQFPRFLRPDLAGVTRFDLSRVYRAPRRPVVVPAERWPRAARERFARPRAGTALAPHLDRPDRQNVSLAAVAGDSARLSPAPKRPPAPTLINRPPRLAAQKHHTASWLDVNARIRSRVCLLPTSPLHEKPP